jgi:hypothetical protein
MHTHILMRGGVTKDQLWELVGSKLAYAAGETEEFRIVCRRNLEEEMRQEWAE